MHFRTFSTDEGLSQVTARAIAQDSNGFLWIGTQDGLNRFDGHGFTTYRHDRDDPHSIAQNHIWDIVPDKDGDLWIATQSGGLSRYDAGLDRFDNFLADSTRSDTLAANHVTALLLDREQRLWVATAAGRLQWLDRATGRFSDVPVGAMPALRIVRAMLQARDGSIWLATRGGLLHLDAQGRVALPVAAEVAQVDAYALGEAADASIWVGTLDAGVLQLSTQGGLLQHLRHDPNAAPGDSLPDNAVPGLLTDPDGTLWLATSNHGLSHYDPEKRRFATYAHDATRNYTVAANRLWRVMRERSGLLIVGSWVNGFSIHDPRTRGFTRIDAVAGEPRALPSRAVPSVHADRDGSLWIGLGEGGGLVHFDPQRGLLQRYVHDPADPASLSHNFVQALTRGRDGSLWVATGGGGLNRLRPGSTGFEHYRHDPQNPGSLAADALVFVREDSAGTLWVGTLDHGLDELCSGCESFRHHVHDPGDPHSIAGDTVNGVLETRSGRFYLAYRLAGFGSFDRGRGRAERLPTQDGSLRWLVNDSVSALYEDRKGRLWIGMQGGGLAMLADANDAASAFRLFSTRQGLAADAVGEIAEDGRGLIWISTTLGISRIDPDSGRIINFGRHEGALSGGYWARSMAQLPDGRIAFGGTEGLTLIDTAAVSLAPAPAPLVTNLLLNNIPAALLRRDAGSPLQRSLIRGGEVQLSHEDDNATFEFASPYFSGAESLRYSYRLDAHDSRWIEADHRRPFATYTDLPSGSYQFRVRVRRDGEDWVKQEGVVKVIVLPPPWASPWAYAGYLLLAGLLALLIAQRVQAGRRAREHVQERIKLSEERLKLALTGSGSELWDVELPSGRMHRENRMEHVAATAEAAEQSMSGFRPFVHPDDLDAFEGRFKAHLHGETPLFEASYRTLDTNREWVWLLTRGRVVDVDANGLARRMSGITQDITALKRAEAALRALNEELEVRVERRTADLRATNVELQHALGQLTLTQRQLLEAEKLASLGGLVAGIAHEINTPLGVGITAASHLAEEATRLSRLLQQERLGRSDLDRFLYVACESAEMILRNLRRADALVKSFKQVAVDQSTEDRRVVELGACIGEILTTLGPSLRKTPHKVELVCAEPVFCETAPGALYQIVSNLVMNSLLHGFVDERPGRIVITIARTGDEVMIGYRDDGVGMDEATRARIFDPFFTTRRGQGGSGLGMHIVYNLVTQSLGGTIRVGSEIGQGIDIAIRFGGGRHVLA
ncbi:MAG: PAS domain-containing protein [Rhodanobacteraceae bacterium]|nr:PAS domain-containing protein [Rhodanobacteraceae bacterium]